MDKTKASNATRELRAAATALCDMTDHALRIRGEAAGDMHKAVRRLRDAVEASRRKVAK